MVSGNFWREADNKPDKGKDIIVLHQRADLFPPGGGLIGPPVGPDADNCLAYGDPFKNQIWAKNMIDFGWKKFMQFNLHGNYIPDYCRGFIDLAGNISGLDFQLNQHPLCVGIDPTDIDVGDMNKREFMILPLLSALSRCRRFRRSPGNPSLATLTGTRTSILSPSPWTINPFRGLIWRGPNGNGIRCWSPDSLVRFLGMLIANVIPRNRIVLDGIR